MTEVAPKVMFMGNYEHKLDPKNRVAIPANWRAIFGQELVLLDSSSNNQKYKVIKCFTHENFAKKLHEIRERALADGHEMGDVDEFIGDIACKSFETEVNTQGKLLIPKQQRDRLKLGEYARLVGRTTHFEIWNNDDFNIAAEQKDAKESSLNKKFRML
jgi:MraZ protein